MRNPSTAAEAIALMTDEAERLNADVNDTTGVVRQIVAANMPGRPDAQFSAWFSITCELADRSARREGFTSSADRAWHRAVEAQKLKV